MQVMQTQDYSLFKRMPGNRQHHRAHLARLKESIAREPDLVRYQPILVNEDYEVIDGQHRLEVLRELEQPVTYIQAPGLRLHEVQTLNTLSKTWTPVDYAKSFIELGNQNYQYYLDIRSKYHLPHKVVLHYLALDTARMESGRFQRGELIVNDLKRTEKLLGQLIEVGAFYPRFSSAAFANAFLKIAMSKEYDHARMLAKMRQRGHLIEDYSLQEDYQRALEATYNYRMRDQRVRFF